MFLIKHEKSIISVLKGFVWWRDYEFNTAKRHLMRHGSNYVVQDSDQLRTIGKHTIHSKHYSNLSQLTLETNLKRPLRFKATLACFKVPYDQLFVGAAL